MNYDANLNTLTATFKRNLIGNNNKDYTFKIGSKYDYKIVFGNYGTSTTVGGTDVYPSPDGKTIEILSATYESTAWRVAATTATIAAMGATFL